MHKIVILGDESFDDDFLFKETIDKYIKDGDVIITDGVHNTGKLSKQYAKENMIPIRVFSYGLKILDYLIKDDILIVFKYEEDDFLDYMIDICVEKGMLYYIITL